MILNLVSLDILELENQYVPDYVQDENRTFETVRVLIDNHQFRNCKFSHCTLLHAGGPFGFRDCEIDGGTILVSTGSAHRGVLLSEALRERPERFFPG